MFQATGHHLHKECINLYEKWLTDLGICLAGRDCCKTVLIIAGTDLDIDKLRIIMPMDILAMTRTDRDIPHHIPSQSLERLEYRGEIFIENSWYTAYCNKKVLRYAWHIL